MKAVVGALFVVCAFVVFGCSGSKDTGSGTEQANDICPSPPQHLTGTVPNGSPCSTFADCVPVCCGCPSSTSAQYLFAECHQGKCNSDTDSCLDADTTGLCP
jgi:hypothetical protein